MSYDKCVATMSRFNNYISNVSNRDRVMSVVQFTAMMLMDPAAAAGHPKLATDLHTILELAAQYRAVTRFSQWFVVTPQLTPCGIRDVIASSPSKLIGILKTISTAFFTVFLLGEEVNMFAKHRIVDTVLGKKFNRARFVFLFWSNVARLWFNVLLLREEKYDAVKDASDPAKVKEHRRKVLTVWDCVLQGMFAYTLLKNSRPAGPAILVSAIQSGGVVDIVAGFAPPVVPVPFTPQGLLGLIASVPGFMISVL